MLLDTSAWVEYFESSKEGAQVKNILKNYACYTSVISLAEITLWCKKNNADAEAFLKTIKNNSILVPLGKNEAELAGYINFESKKRNKKFGMVDSLIIATARILNLNVLTKDNDFKEFEECILLKNLNDNGAE